jgi:hypothetical protein
MSASALEYYHVRPLAAEEAVLENEVRVVIRPMTGTEYILAVAEHEFATTIAVYMAEVLGIEDWSRIRLCLNYQPIAQDEPIGCLLPELEKAEHVIDMLIDEAVVRIPSAKPFALIGHHRYGFGGAAVAGW